MRVWRGGELTRDAQSCLVLSVVVPIAVGGVWVSGGSVAVGLSLLPGKKVTLARGQGVPFGALSAPTCL